MKTTAEIILKVNYSIFAWYYKRVPAHFHQWTIIKSIKILIDNYNQQKFELKGQDELIRKFLEIDKETQTKLHDLRMQQIATPAQIRWMNNKFGTKFTEPNDN